MINRKTPDLENKLLILFAIDQMGPLTGLQLLQFLVECDLMDYITMQLTLGDLMSTSHLQMTSSPLGPRYMLTDAGRESLALFSRRLPNSMRSMVKSAVPEWKPRFQRETQMLSSFQRREDGAYTLLLQLLEADSPLLEATLLLPSRDLADQLSRNWQKTAPSFYAQLMQELGDSFSLQDQTYAPLVQGVVIEPCGQGYALRLHHAESSLPAISLSVLLPTMSMAASFAKRWESKAGALCAFLMGRLIKE